MNKAMMEEYWNSKETGRLKTLSKKTKGKTKGKPFKKWVITLAPYTKTYYNDIVFEIFAKDRSAASNEARRLMSIEMSKKENKKYAGIETKGINEWQPGTTQTS